MTKDRSIFETLPALQKEMDSFQSVSFATYEDKLEQATEKALHSLSIIIEDGSLALDPEQLVYAVKVLTDARKGLFESKRKLIETTIRGQAMMAALSVDDDKNTSLLDKYLGPVSNVKESENNSNFPSIEDAESDTD